MANTLALFAVSVTLAFGVSAAVAQNAPTPTVSPSPNSINKGERPTVPSGSEAKSAATGSPSQISGNKKFCKQTSSNNTLNCIYTSMNTCEKHNKSDALRCVANPRFGT